MKKSLTFIFMRRQGVLLATRRRDLFMNEELYEEDVMRALTLKEMSAVVGGCKANNGWGNGDDSAPGNSLNHNQAENNVRPGANHKGTAAQPLELDAMCHPVQ